MYLIISENNTLSRNHKHIEFIEMLIKISGIRSFFQERIDYFAVQVAVVLGYSLKGNIYEFTL